MPHSLATVPRHSKKMSHARCPSRRIAVDASSGTARRSVLHVSSAEHVPAPNARCATQLSVCCPLLLWLIRRAPAWHARRPQKNARTTPAARVRGDTCRAVHTCLVRSDDRICVAARPCPVHVRLCPWAWFVSCVSSPFPPFVASVGGGNGRKERASTTAPAEMMLRKTASSIMQPKATARGDYARNLCENLHPRTGLPTPASAEFVEFQ